MMRNEEELFTEKKRGRKIFFLIVLIFILLLSIKRIFFSDPHAVDSAGYVMPGTLSRDFDGFDLWQYYIYFFENKFAGYPWVVKVSYGLVLYSILIWAIVAGNLIYFIYKQFRHATMYQRLYEKYHDKLRDIMLSKEDLSLLAVNNRMNLKGRNYTSELYRIWFKLFRALHVEFGSQISINNRTNVAQILGMIDYATRTLADGKVKEKIRILQSIRQLLLPVPDSLMSKLVNDRNLRLRKLARLYYCLVNKEDPYVILDNGYLNEQFVTWDAMELHQMTSLCFSLKKPAPYYLPIIDNIESPVVKSLFISEAGFWGTDDEMAGLMKFFDSSESEYKKAAYRSMGTHKYIPAEESMMTHYVSESGDIRRTILTSIAQIHSGKADDFLKKAYLLAIAENTRRGALYCLWRYSDKSREYFYELKSQASEGEQILFYHVENEMINSTI